MHSNLKSDFAIGTYIMSRSQLLPAETVPVEEAGTVFDSGEENLNENMHVKTYS